MSKYLYAELEYLGLRDVYLLRVFLPDGILLFRHTSSAWHLVVSELGSNGWMVQPASHKDYWLCHKEVGASSNDVLLDLLSQSGWEPSLEYDITRHWWEDQQSSQAVEMPGVTPAPQQFVTDRDVVRRWLEQHHIDCNELTKLSVGNWLIQTNQQGRDALDRFQQKGMVSAETLGQGGQYDVRLKIHQHAVVGESVMRDGIEYTLVDEEVEAWLKGNNIPHLSLSTDVVETGRWLVLMPLDGIDVTRAKIILERYGAHAVATAYKFAESVHISFRLPKTGWKNVEKTLNWDEPIETPEQTTPVFETDGEAVQQWIIDNEIDCVVLMRDTPETDYWLIIFPDTLRTDLAERQGQLLNAGAVDVDIYARYVDKFELRFRLPKER